MLVGAGRQLWLWLVSGSSGWCQAVLAGVRQLWLVSGSLFQADTLPVPDGGSQAALLHCHQLKLVAKQVPAEAGMQEITLAFIAPTS